MSKLWALTLILLVATGCGDAGKGKNKENFQDIPKPEEKKPDEKK